MPKRARSGAVSRPLRVVAPTKVNGLRSIWMDRAEGPLSIMMSMRKSSIAEYRYSSTTGERRWISSMKSTSLRSSEVRMPARSPGLSRTGPEVILKPTPSSMMLLKVVFPSPGGPWSKVWSSGSPRYLAASTNTRRLSTTPRWPLKSSKRSGLSAFSNSFSAVESGRCSLISKLSAINLICKYTKKRPHGKGNGAFSSSAPFARPHPQDHVPIVWPLSAKAFTSFSSTTRRASQYIRTMQESNRSKEQVVSFC